MGIFILLKWMLVLTWHSLQTTCSVDTSQLRTVLSKPIGSGSVESIPIQDSFISTIENYWQSLPRLNEVSSAASFSHSHLQLDKGADGIGVVAKDFIPSGTCVVVAPTLVLPTLATSVFHAEHNFFMDQNHSFILPNILSDYSYHFPIPNFTLLGLGPAAYFNHCPDHNTIWRMIAIPDRFFKLGNRNIYRQFALYFEVITDVHPGQELCTNYGSDFWSSRIKSPTPVDMK